MWCSDRSEQFFRHLPHSSFVLSFIHSFFTHGLFFVAKLEVCTGKNEQDFVATPEMLAKAATMPYPELHQASTFNELQFYTCLRDFLAQAGYPNFSWRDLHVPTPKRLRFQLSAIINMAKFREEQLQIYQELIQPVRPFLYIVRVCLLEKVSQLFPIHRLTYCNHLFAFLHYRGTSFVVAAY